MTAIGTKVRAHPSETELADYLSGLLNRTDRQRLEEHAASCPECLEKMVSAHESVSKPGKGKISFMKKINLYLFFAVATFIFSFITPQYFLQLLVATIILGMKWIVDSKSMKMLIMIHEAWKNGGEKEASRIFEAMDRKSNTRF